MPSGQPGRLPTGVPGQIRRTGHDPIDPFRNGSFRFHRDRRSTGAARSRDRAERNGRSSQGKDFFDFVAGPAGDHNIRC
jgi:hypothetical protein